MRQYIDNVGCETCKHCIDKTTWTCEIDEPCVNHSYYESETKREMFNEIET